MATLAAYTTCSALVAVALLLAATAAAQQCTSAVAGCVCETGAVTSAQYDAMYATLATAVQQSKSPRRGQRPEDFVGAIVRLSFHDAGEFLPGSDDSFRSDGFVHIDNGDNAGLQQVIAQLDTLWRQHCSVVSRADFWVLAAKVAIEQSGTPADYELPFRFGRVDAATCAYTGTRLPSSQGGLGEIERVFVTQMGMTMRDAVALLGAHTLGRMQEVNSGYEGSWVNGRDAATFNNEYFRELLGRPWRRTDNGLSPADRQPLEQWEAGPQLMLNTDMSIAFHIGVDGDTVGANNNVCGGRQLLQQIVNQAPPPPRGPNGPPPPPAGANCQLSDTFADSHEFALDNAAFLAAFATAFGKMTEVGYAAGDLVGLDVVSDSSSTTTATTTTTTSTSTTTTSTTTTTTTATTTTTTPTSTSTSTTTTALDGSDGCTDDAAWARTNGRTCVWVSSNPAQRCDQTGTDGRRAWLACPEACGACQAARCADDAAFRARVGRRDRSCTWIRRHRPGRNCLRTGIGGVPAHAACPDACGGFTPDSCPDI